MSKKLFYSDPHFGHEKTCTTFVGHDGRPLRPFKDADEMNVALIQRYKAAVGENDTVVWLGDICINKKFLYIVRELPGKKIIVLGNHDKEHISAYTELFDDVCGYYIQNRAFIASHVPLHPSELTRWKRNVHGHLHSGEIGTPEYLCVSVERTGYAPITLDEIEARYEARGLGWK